MPELPEVETSRRGIAPHILGHTVNEVIIRQRQLRWPITRALASSIRHHRLDTLARRGKYLLLGINHGTVIIHLGMSGSLRVCPPGTAFDKHDHIDIVFDNDKVLRLHDPRKFGCVLWTDKPVEQHKLLAGLGPEPLGDEFTAEYLHRISRKRSCSIKSLIMNSQRVVGVGNIYACESLFIAGINPVRKAGSLGRARCDRLVAAIKQVLSSAIAQGGTTLRDFTREDGKPGYFAQHLFVYGRGGEPCLHCGKPVKQFTQQQRSTFYCTHCQK